MTWKKYTRDRAKFGGRAPRTTTAVRKNRTQDNAAFLLLPADMAAGKMATVYTNGGDKIAFSIGERGDFKIGNANKRGTLKTVVIPRALADRIPYGTRDCTTTRDGDMIVLDLAQFDALRVAAE